MFLDECSFKSDGKMNSWHNRYWTIENSYWLRKFDHQYLCKVKVWCGVLNAQSIRLYFIDRNLTSVKYIELIEGLLAPIPLQFRQHMWFQQDGWMEKVDAMFSNMSVEKYGLVSYPPRSPDLAIFDYCSWGIWSIESVLHQRMIIWCSEYQTCSSF